MIDWKKELRDQSAHLAAGAVAIAPIMLMGLNPISGAWATLCLGLVREITEWQCAKKAKQDIIDEVDKLEFSDFKEFGRLIIPQLSIGNPWSIGSLRDLFFWAASGFLVGWL